MSSDSHQFDGADVGEDPFFTARVLTALPARPLGARLLPLPRLLVILVAYAIAAGIGYAVVVDDQSVAMVRVSTTLSGLFAFGGYDHLLGYAGPVALVVAVVAVAFAATRAHTDAA